MSILHAKAARYGLTLATHLSETEEAARRLFDGDHRVARSWRRFFRLPPEQGDRFLLNLRVAALLHDIGKANQDFQALVQGQGRGQFVRHEHLSALLLHTPALRGWLRKDPRLDVEVITAAVLSHHLKAHQDGPYRWGELGGLARRLAVYFDHPEVIATMDHLAKILERADRPALPTVPYGDHAPWNDAFEDGHSTASRFGRNLEQRDPARHRLLLATKAALIAADAAASGLSREGHTLSWLDGFTGAAPVTAADVEQSILGPRCAAIAQGSKKPFTYQRFQDLVAGEGDRLLLLAGCGSGKTLAAWRWAQARAGATGRVIFLYPTRATATEGFRDYVGFAPEDEAMLLHGTASYELREMAQNPAERLHGDKDFSQSEAEARLFAIGLWPRRYFSATVDQFLSFMENDFRALCLLPALADSLLIIDEVHSFSHHMFEVLLNFLKRFTVPVLCMTATLDRSRIEQLKATGMACFPRPEHDGELQDLRKAEGHLRYRLERVPDESAALQQAIAAYQEGRRVLWVVNQVARCQRLWRLLRDSLGPQVLCYHSQFTLEDRKDRHRAVIGAFKQTERPAIAVTTQVCEMSLDLDADVLLSEEAPISSLVQRWGRANRTLEGKSEGFLARLLCYKPEDDAPYTRDELEAARIFLAALGSAPLSQHTLATELARHEKERSKPQEHTRFLSDGYFALPGSFRDADDYSQPCLLDDRLAQALALMKQGDREALEGLVVNVPRRAAQPMPAGYSALPRHLGVASAARYQRECGFQAAQEII